jgi:2-oxoglutarate dehydrogenase E2 component (dihydrolipoamide succinyltransferase)
MGESLSEGTLTKWLKKAGDSVERDEPLFEISTDKVDTEVPAPVSGVLEKTLVSEGQTVPVGTVVGTIAAAGVAPQETVSPAPPQQVAPAGAPSAAAAPGGGHFAASHQTVTFQRRPASSSPAAVPEDRKNYFSPAVMALALEHGLSLEEISRIQGTGLGGRVTRRDVEAHLARRNRAAAALPDYAVPGLGYSAPPHPLPPALSQGENNLASASTQIPTTYAYRPGPEDTLVPMSALRKRIADQMTWSQRVSAAVTSFAECDLHRIHWLCDDRRTDFEASEGIPLTMLPFVADATVRALREFPIVNASVLGDQIVFKRHIHLGIAVSLDDGLVVPVVRNADEMNFVGLARAIHELMSGGRTKPSAPQEAQEATFTITNPGLFGGLTGTLTIPQPQIAILGLGATAKKPVVIDDGIAIRPIMVLALSFDHRIIDSATGFQFLEKIRLQLEHFEWT